MQETAYAYNLSRKINIFVRDCRMFNIIYDYRPLHARSREILNNANNAEKLEKYNICYE